MVNTKIRLITFFAAKDGEALYSQQKQDQELTVAPIMNSLLPNSQTPQNTLLDMSLHFRERRSSSTHHKTETSFSNQKTFTSH